MRVCKVIAHVRVLPEVDAQPVGGGAEFAGDAMELRLVRDVGFLVVHRLERVARAEELLEARLEGRLLLHDAGNLFADRAGDLDSLGNGRARGDGEVR